MIVTCPRCLTKFNLPDENLELNLTLNLRCSRCLEEFLCPVVREEVLPLSDGMASVSVNVDSITDSEPRVEETVGEDQVDDAEFELNIDELCLSDGDDPIDGALDSAVAEDPEPDSPESNPDSTYVLLEEEEVPDVQEPAAGAVEESISADPGNRRPLIIAMAAFLILGLFSWGGYSLWRHAAVDMEKALQITEVKNQYLTLPSEKVVLIMRGQVVNNSEKTVTNLKLKGVLQDGSGKVVARVKGLGGVNLAASDIELLDSQKLTLLEKRACSLQPRGGRQYFTVIFYDCPENARKCYAEISAFKVQ
jgi:predicted Zn finger-like uncharacterized protein